MASAADVLLELKSLGTAHTAKTYRRHGAGENVYGVLTRDLAPVKKRIGTDHALARELWASGNYDARVLATMVADPARATDRELDAWVREIDSYPLTFYVARVAAQHPRAVERAEKWIAADAEWTERTGWQVLAALALDDKGVGTLVPDAYFSGLLPTIESKVHTAKNRVRDAMNEVVIAVGARNESLMKKALPVAKRIGKVDVFHGDTACKTPEAAPYIEKIWTRRGARNK